MIDARNQRIVMDGNGSYLGMSKGCARALNELDKLERQADILMRHLEVNGKKLRQEKLKDHTWNTRRLEATLRIVNELLHLAEMINELWEHPDRAEIVGSI